MRVSVITINRNNSSGLARTLSSVSNQTNKEFEYIIVDGASTDGSVDVIKKFNADGISSFKWVSEPDSGIYNAMNKGAALASGDYLLFLNSGDSFAGSYVIGSIKDINADIVIGRINFIDANGVYHCDYQCVFGNCSLYGFMNSLIPHQATLVKRETFKRIGPYNERYKIVADWQYCLKALILNDCTLEYIPVTISDFDNTGISSIDNGKMMNEIDLAFQETVPISIYNDYKWALSHKSDIERIKWLRLHRFCYFFFKLFVSVGRFVGRK